MITRILITVKTYPTLSHTHGELVCTAGFREDGKFIRVYPIPFRKLEHELKYKKYQWVEMDIEKNKKDFRPESYRLRDVDSIKLCDKVDTSHNWHYRKEIVLKNSVYTNLTELIADAKNKDKCISLAVFKPKNILDVKVEETTREWDSGVVDTIMNQGDLFDQKDFFHLVKKLPYKFSYTYEDAEGKKSTLMIEDWEIGQLYWNCLKMSDNNEKEACRKVREKLVGFITNNDAYFFLGTTLEYHAKNAPNPFIIVGLFYPKKEEEVFLF